jgi:DNA-binding CsgD family transcriptional regulator
MLTNEEFKLRWKQLSNKQRKFCLRYIENGFSAKDAAIEVGYNGCYIKSPIYRIMRKVNDVIDYLIAKNNIVQSVVKPRLDFATIHETL